MSRLFVAILLFGLLPVVPSAGLVAAQDSTQIVELRHRTATEMMMAINGLLKESEQVTVMDNKLVLRGDKASIEKLADTIRQLDTARRQLRIRMQAQAPASVSIGGSGGLSASTRDRGDAFVVTTLDGQPAFVEFTQTTQAVWGSLRLVWPGLLVDGGQNEQQVSSGFYVLPQLQGKQVQLQIASREGRFRDNNAYRSQQQQVHTTVRVPLGQWKEIGGNADRYEDAARSQGGLSAHTRSKQSQSLWVRVDPVKE